MRPLLIVLLLARVAAADTIALVSDDPALHAALDDAVGHVVVSAEKPPAVGELGAASRAIADREGASATVWLIASEQGATLVTYDRGVDRTIVRELPYAPPLDAAQAAGTARMVRTMLGSLRIVEVRQTDLGFIMRTPPEYRPQFALGVGAGAWFAGPAASVNPSATVTAAWRPHGLGVAVTGTVAPAPDLAMPAFTGDVRDVVIGAELRNALDVQLDGPVFLVPAVGASLHMLHVRGDTVDSTRFDPAVRVGMAANYDLGHDLEAGLDVSADCLLRRQSYQAGTQQILVVPRVQIVTAFVVAIRL